MKFFKLQQFNENHFYLHLGCRKAKVQPFLAVVYGIFDMKSLIVISAALMMCASSSFAKKVELSPASVVAHYADIAFASYQDSLTAAQALQQALVTLSEDPTEANLLIARDAWKTARIPYMQTEAFRFGNPIVDDWEGKVNAWPLDEGLIDYVAQNYGTDSEDNPYYTANVIAKDSISLSGNTIDTSEITKELLSETLHEVDGVEANVATGYHAIEFLLWGQDLNGTEAGAGNRPASDFDAKNCKVTNCAKRAQYLVVAGELLVDDLVWMAEQWKKEGAARMALQENPADAVNAIFTGMGSLSYGELAGERIKLGVLLHDPEEEHDCFSDNTHNSHFYDVQGIANVYLGTYTTVKGDVLSGPSLSSLIKAQDKSVDAELVRSLNGSLAAAQSLVDSAEEKGVAYDQLLAEGNTAGNAKIIKLVNALLEQTKAIEAAVASYGLAAIEFEGSDSLSDETAVFQ